MDKKQQQKQNPIQKTFDKPLEKQNPQKQNPSQPQKKPNSNW